MSIRTPTPPNQSTYGQISSQPVALRALSDGFMDSLVWGMTKNAETDEGSQKIDCPACSLMPSTRRGPAKLKFSKRHIDEVHLHPLASAVSKGEQISAELDTLWMAMVSIKVKRRQADQSKKPTSQVRAEAENLIEYLRVQQPERPHTMEFPNLRAWSITYADKIDVEQSQRKCPICGKAYTRLSSRDRHNCAGTSPA